MSSSAMSSLLSSRKNRRPSMSLPLRRLQLRGCNMRARCESGRQPRIERGLKECDWQSFSAFQLSEASRPLHMHRRWSALNTEVWVQPHCTQCLWCYSLNIPCWSCCFQSWIRAVWWVKSYLGFSIKWIDRASRYLVSVGFGSSLQICTLCLPRWVWFVVAVAKDNSIQ